MACASSDADPDPHTDDTVPREVCAWAKDAELAARPYELPEGCPEGSLPVGTPPQGGAPFLPLRLRLHADLGEDVFRLDAAGQAMAGATVLGEEAVGVSALCANTGSDAGWYLLGELHLRFPGLEQADLDGVPLDVTAEVSWDGGQASWTLSGPACWAL